MIIFKDKGFTLIELLVTISIIVIFSAIGLASYIEFNRRQIVVQAAQTIVSDLRLTQNKALSGEKDRNICGAIPLSGWSVKFNTSNYEIYGECGAVSFSNKIYNLPKDFKTISMVEPNNILTFKPLVGGVNPKIICLSGLDRTYKLEITGSGEMIDSGIVNTGDPSCIPPEHCWGINGNCDIGCNRSSQSSSVVYTGCSASGTCGSGGQWLYNTTVCKSTSYYVAFGQQDCLGNQGILKISNLCSTDGSGTCFTYGAETGWNPNSYRHDNGTCYNYNPPFTTYGSVYSCSWNPGDVYTNYAVSGSTTKYTGSGTCDSRGSGSCYKLNSGSTFYTAGGCGGCGSGTYYNSVATCSWI